MSLQVLASQAQPPITRPSVNYSPSIWGDHFLSYAEGEVDSNLEQRLQGLKREVNMMLMTPMKVPTQKLDLVNDIQRLGVSYHFENVIDNILRQFYQTTYSTDLEDDDDLYSTALCFRLLRQHGYNVSCDVFKKFKEGNHDKFKESLTSDVSGLLSLHEATHLRIHGEYILEEALAFTTTHLESMKNSLRPLLSKQVAHSLKQALRKGVNRVEARYYLSIYGERDLHNETLLTFAKLDFNLLQQLHQKELSELTRWWKDLDVENNLPFTRDRITEVYFIWVLSIYFEPQYSFARKTLCKITAIISVIDDIYDNKGTLEELELFTEAIQRWDINVIDPLPDYMKVCYKVLLDVYAEIQEELAKEGKLYKIHYAIDAMKKQATNYWLEAKGLHQRHIATMDEYMDLAVVSTGYLLLMTISFVGMGDIATQASFDWLAAFPRTVEGASVICRLMDDIAEHKFEQNGENVTSAVTCCMKEYGITGEEAIIRLDRQVSDAWKDINESFLYPDAVPRPLLTRILNFACAMDVAFKFKDGYTTHHEILLKDFIVSTLVQSVPV